MTSAGPSEARTQPAWGSSATRAGEDTASRRGAAVSDVLGVSGVDAQKTKVTCTVKYSGGSAQSRPLHWRLSRAGHTVRSGTASHGRLDLGRLPAGHYRLQFRGQQGSRSIVVG